MRIQKLKIDRKTLVPKMKHPFYLTVDNGIWLFVPNPYYRIRIKEHRIGKAKR